MTELNEPETNGKEKGSISDADHKRQHDMRVLAGTLITTEQSLINNRMTWMMTFQGLLFASFALTASTTNDPNIKTIITDVVPYVGLAVASITLIGIVAAFLSITNIKKSLSHNLSSFKVEIENGIIPYGTLAASILGRSTAYLFPTIIAFTWIIIAYKVHTIKVIRKAEQVKQTTVISNADMTKKTIKHSKK